MQWHSMVIDIGQFESDMLVETMLRELVTRDRVAHFLEAMLKAKKVVLDRP